MGLPHIAVCAAITLSGLWPSSCSKAPAPSQRAKAAETNVVAAAKPSKSKTEDLGVIQLTNHLETEINLGKGASCTIKPLMVDRHNLQLTLSFGSKNAEGKPTGLCITRVNAKSDLPFDITVNEVALTFTPKLVE